MKFTIHRKHETDNGWILKIVRGWGADFIVTRGRCVYPTEIEGFYATADDGRKTGLVTYEVIGDQCEIVTLDAFEKFSGVGTALIEAVIENLRSRKVNRLWLITTNDNLDAIRFYQRRGFTIAAVHVNALAASRKLKPTIAEIGQHNIPLRDEIEFEMMLE